MFNLHVIATVLGAEEPSALPIEAHWFGIIMFVLLMFLLLITMSFADKGRQLPAAPHSDH
ncbi:hypothetical protein LTH96_05440 [Nesterenkonia sp. LB17]|uniref:hypothetical protein n=1 Tax=unclassified Nesterenkonia TaxID=2629769 RepID=UPI001F4CFCD6|nr:MULTISPECIES: hypothetical protein [unclassified Nesterenkonia]MCH8559091.1 hypothetical protein [Nesterenkonia sp. DZ6]MCH8563005.1 hypothetical protein [Nesterenkonia sp. YGD6]MCH8565178.1 hypothetical protein [Nesterenkonia sp. LB17]MCH8571426.1 hypothetical protein [Nesterenkonia sp. AY15]